MANTKTTPRRGVRRKPQPQQSGAQKALGALSAALPGILEAASSSQKGGRGRGRSRGGKASGLLGMLKRR